MAKELITKKLTDVMTGSLAGGKVLGVTSDGGLAQEMKEEYILKSEKGTANGVATLDAQGKLVQGIDESTLVKKTDVGVSVAPLNGGKLPNVNLNFGTVSQDNANVVSGGEVYRTTNSINDTLDTFLIRKNLFNRVQFLENTTINVVSVSANLTYQLNSRVAYVRIEKDEFYTLQLDNKFNTAGYRIALFPNLELSASGSIGNNRITTPTFKNTNESFIYVCFGIKYQSTSEANPNNIQLEKGQTATSIVNYDDVLIPYSKLSDTPYIPTIDVKRYFRNVVGKNLFDFGDLLIGKAYSSSSGYVDKSDGIMSNKLYLSAGNNTVQGLKPYTADTVRILGFNDKDEMLFADAITMTTTSGYYQGTYRVLCSPKFYNVNYFRIALQYESALPLDEKTAQITFLNSASTFEAPIIKLVENPNYGKTTKTIFASGASTTVSSNGWFERACRELGFKHINKSISGDSVMQHADLAYKGMLWTKEEMENIDILSLSHNHNYNVNFQGKEFEKVDSLGGFFTTSNNFSVNSSWVVDKYNVTNNDTPLLVSSVASASSEPFITFFDQKGISLGNLPLTFTTAIQFVENVEIIVPVNTAFVYVKRRNLPNSYTTLRGKTIGVLSNTVQEYENKGYDSSNNPLPLGTLNPENPNQRLLPFGSAGASGSQLGDNVINERYAAGYDYLIKKYRQECYNLRNEPTSKWFGTQRGKPCMIIICSHWHDGYVVFNENAKKLCDRVGAIYADTATKTGFTYKTTNPNDLNSIRWSALVCNNRAFSSGNDEHDEPINGIIYTNMGFHPTRDVNSYFNIRRANIFKDVLTNILL